MISEGHNITELKQSPENLRLREIEIKAQSARGQYCIESCISANAKGKKLRKGKRPGKRQTIGNPAFDGHTMISDGCLYHCDFCCVKTHNAFQPRSKEDISRQIRELKRFYDSNLKNYNALFLRNHDALGVGGDLLCDAALESFNEFEFDSSCMKKPTLHLFSSVDSLLNTVQDDFRKINHLPYKTFINIGLESVDAASLSQIGKPLNVRDVEAAYYRLREVNKNFLNIEITANFVIGEKLPPNHYRSLIELTVKTFDEFTNKGAIYISPLIKDKNKRELLRSFIRIKSMSRMPTYLYLIHRL